MGQGRQGWWQKQMASLLTIYLSLQALNACEGVGNFVDLRNAEAVQYGSWFWKESHCSSSSLLLLGDKHPLWRGKMQEILIIWMFIPSVSLYNCLINLSLTGPQFYPPPTGSNPAEKKMPLYILQLRRRKSFLAQTEEVAWSCCGSQWDQLLSCPLFWEVWLGTGCWELDVAVPVAPRLQWWWVLWCCMLLSTSILCARGTWATSAAPLFVRLVTWQLSVMNRSYHLFRISFSFVSAHSTNICARGVPRTDIICLITSVQACP